MVKKDTLILNTSIYSVSSIVTQFLSLFFLKINTNILTTAKYGQYAILLTVQSMLAIFISLGINSGFARFFREYEDHNRLKNNILTFGFIWSLLMFGIVFLLKGQISPLISKNDPLASQHIILITLNSILTFFIGVYETSFKMEYKALKLTITEVSIIILNLGFLFLFGLYLKRGISGILTAYLLARIIVFIILFLGAVKKFYFVIDIEPLKKMLLYGTGLMMGNVSAWILTFIDRYFLKFYIGLSIVGIYAVGYRLGKIIRPLFIIPFKKTFTPFQLEVYKENRGKEKIKKMFKYYCIVGWIFIFFIAVFGKPAIKILSTPEYTDAFKIIPLIAMSYFIFMLTAFFGFGLHVENKMFLNSFIVTLGAIFNIALNFLLIPPLKMYGAALSTIISYILVNIIYYFVGKIYWDTTLDFFYPYKVGLSFVFFYLWYFFFVAPMNNILIEAVLSIVLLAIYIYSFIFLKYISKEEVEDILSLGFSKISSKVKNAN